MRAAIERERKKCNRRRATLPRDESKAGEKSVFLKQDGQRFILKNEQAKRRRENHERAKKHAMSRLPSWCLLLPSSGAKEISARNDPRVGRTKKKPRNPFTSRFESRESVLLKRPTKQKTFLYFCLWSIRWRSAKWFAFFLAVSRFALTHKFLRRRFCARRLHRMVFNISVRGVHDNKFLCRFRSDGYF